MGFGKVRQVRYGVVWFGKVRLGKFKKDQKVKFLVFFVFNMVLLYLYFDIVT